MLGVGLLDLNKVQGSTCLGFQCSGLSRGSSGGLYGSIRMPKKGFYA